MAFFVNLGIYPFIDDEGNRASVALEMLWSGNFITPTLHGEYYYNKPPLWNWILAVCFTLMPEPNEWGSRIPAVLSLLGFTVTVFYSMRSPLGRERALLVAFMLLTCGRILLWESLLGLIDIFFSWVVFAQIMLLYHKGERDTWWQAFGWSYLLTAIGFMLKGLPAIAFQGLTVITYLLWRDQWKRFFSAAHIISGLGAVALLAVYYAVYHQYNSLENVFTTLFVESGKRTAAAYSIIDIAQHMAGFPLELFYHFLPWTLLIILAFNASNRKRWRKHRFVHFCGLALGVNLIIYWLSPNFYPRYILMLLPLGFAPLAVLLSDTKDTLPKLEKVLQVLLGLFILLLAGAAAGAYFNDRTQIIPHLGGRASSACLLLLLSLYYYWRVPTQRYFTLVLAMLIFRLGFDVLVLPSRANYGSGIKVKTSIQLFAERRQTTDLAVFYESHMEPATTFYLHQTYQKPIPRQMTQFDTLQPYIFSPEQYDIRLFHPPIDSFRVRHSCEPHYYLARLRTTDSLAIEAYTIAYRPSF